MGRKSIKEGKTIYQLKREEVGLTREQAAERLYISEDSIERIESQKKLPAPDDVVRMSEIYREPSLCNYYCSRQCPIGNKYVPEIANKDLRQIVLEMMISMNRLEKKQERLLEISIDNTVDDDQVEDFVEIQRELEKVSVLVETLQFWAEEMLAEGKINKEAFEKARAKGSEG